MMSAPKRQLRRRLSDGEQVTGCLLRMPAEETVEMLGVAGFDFVLIDCEHGPADVTALRQHIALAQLHGMAPLVRVGLHEHQLILRALDQGAEGIVAPHIDTASDADELVDAVHYPPLGHRGFATYSRAGRFGTVSADEHHARSRQETLVIAMLESPEAAGNAGEILRRPGVDGCLIGTADLRASLDSGSLTFAEALALIRRQSWDAGSFRADLASSRTDAEKALDDGAQLVVYNLAHIMMDLFGTLRGS
ncbi:HpcH/HpaI aldolase family protein [Nesterenkonia xinjiangensis]|uniref:4-hydroxy-2-oxoheptanedioate aldolase n=1 Tax=Nesterenkonia xinjiangensis TaxID=225327 RepID=A0A7Z0GJS1_9MICC|nr:aldolase/citrate lyase family protein [Nesterenkonia xinjiangensis]NYJ77265.1 4-hydroxy-2-oxoheptanedioate aldolase [Nesterenkonia xinjiangensis]